MQNEIPKSFFLSTKKWINCLSETNPVDSREKSGYITCGGAFIQRLRWLWRRRRRWWWWLQMRAQRAAEKSLAGCLPSLASAASVEAEAVVATAAISAAVASTAAAAARWRPASQLGGYRLQRWRRPSFLARVPSFLASVTELVVSSFTLSSFLARVTDLVSARFRLRPATCRRRKM